MKKFYKILLIISGILAALGIVFVGIGTVKGGKAMIESDLINNRLAAHLDIGDWFDDDDFDDENMSSISRDSVVRIEREKNAIRSLEVKAKYGEVKINQWDEVDFGVENKTNKLEVKYEVIQGVLNISVSGKHGLSHHNGKVNIYIPKDKLDNIDLSIGAGEVECSGMSADHLKIEVGAGEGKIHYSEFGQCDIDVGVGELDIENTTVSGMNVDCGIGEVKAALNNAYTDFDYNLKVGAGEIELGAQTYEGLSNSVKLSNGAGKVMDIDCGMGEVTVKFMK